ncbi:CocE/NonD family hydrolase [Paractinoplanes durhamensis]|uniref:X-Pro dipeptidyl-peptidase n=1 Tax=Paractinoplanes durhamensis TaxID=113563 RepID=A0ABQ3YY40_9ACTN|nr:CocE/NonD family hydrolase [Actinoplanes durhamensis]GIE02502.1 X-Pro dipeptidyl-peptidase [Actinoplanes durhamensis]
MLRRLTSLLLHKAFPGMPPATHRYEVRRNIEVPMSDGTLLLGDLYLPFLTNTQKAPTVLIRSPYGRAGIGAPICRLLAEQGFPVFSQSCRGTAGSGGVFTPQLNEQSDGIDTHEWVRAQPWFTGRLVTTGMSYLGYTQWAVAGKTQPDAMCLQVTMPDFGAVTWDNGAFSLRNALGWSAMMARRDRFAAPLRQVLPDRRLAAAFDHLPLAEGDRVSTGATIDWYQDWVNRADLGDDYWTAQSHTAAVPEVTAPVSMIAGWYDIFLPWQLRTYRQLVEAGNPPELTVGPWGHASPPLLRDTPAAVHNFLTRRLMGGPATRPDPVRVYVTGAEEWRGYAEWPPPGVRTSWLLHPEGGLGLGPAPVCAPSRYVYDPADPTPALGGPALDPKSGPVDNTEHERRADVLTFTSVALTEAVEVLGEPVATIALRSDRANTDLFVRICDVHPDGKSWTVCDGIRRVDADAEEGEVTVPLWPTAHRFRAGHRIRIQISSGAHPRYARNTGGDEPPGTARILHRAHQEIRHDPSHRSRVDLPTRPAV